MALPPNIDNYTIPGGIKLFFDDGTGERDLGNIVSLDITPGTDELEHFSNRSGKRLKDHSLVIEEKLTIKMVLDEIVAEHWKYFFKGDDITNLGAGTGSATDVKLTLESTTFMALAGYYGLSAVTVRQFLDYCLDFDGTSTYVDNSTEADSLAGTPFTLFATDDHVAYFGKATPFEELYVDVGSAGSLGARTWEFWNGSTWTAVVPTGTGEDFSADGKITFGAMTNFAETTVNGKEAYWVRCSVASVTTAPTINCIRQNAVALTDYMLDAGVAGQSGRQAGRIARIAAGFLADGEEVKVSFTYTTWTSQQFNLAMAGGFPEGAARIEMHPTTGRGTRIDIEIPKCQLKPTDNISFNDKEWLQIPLTLEVLDDTNNNPTYPMGRVLVYE